MQPANQNEEAGSVQPEARGEPKFTPEGTEGPRDRGTEGGAEAAYTPWYAHPNGKYPRVIFAKIDGREVQVAEATIPRVDDERAVEIANQHALLIAAVWDLLAACGMHEALENYIDGQITAGELDAFVGRYGWRAGPVSVEEFIEKFRRAAIAKAGGAA